MTEQGTPRQKPETPLLVANLTVDGKEKDACRFLLNLIVISLFLYIFIHQCHF